VTPVALVDLGLVSEPADRSVNIHLDRLQTGESQVKPAAPIRRSDPQPAVAAAADRAFKSTTSSATATTTASAAATLINVSSTAKGRWLMRGLDPELKSVRAANYIVGLRSELLSLARACGARHPALIDAGRIEVVGARYSSTPFRDVFGYSPEWPVVSAARRAEVEALVGEPAPPAPPGPDAGEQAGFPGAGDPTRGHQDVRGMGSARSEAG